MSLIAGDTIDQAIALKDGSFAVHDTEKGYMVYKSPIPESQITSTQWKEIAEATLRQKNGN